MLETITTTATEAEVNDALDYLALIDFSEATDEEIAEAVEEALGACGDIEAKLVAAGLWNWVIGKVVDWIKNIWEKTQDWTKTIIDKFLENGKIFVFTPPSGSGPGGNP
jgi:hypothetical protein